VREIERIERWRRAYRLEAPDLFRGELDAVLDLLSQRPHLGTLRESKRHDELRRILLRRTRYHVYFAVVDGGRYVDVLACWGGQRGRAPRLGSSC
jgi:plasmid stabilization system protein ParE